MRLLPGLRPGPRWGAYSAPQTPSWERLCIPKKVSLIFFSPNDMPVLGRHVLCIVPDALVSIKL